MAKPDTADLTAMIDALVESKTFNLDAIDGIKALRDQANALQGKLQFTIEELKVSQSKLNFTETTLSAANQKIADWVKRETDLKAREAAITKLELDKAVANAKSGIWDLAMSRMLANRQIRESITDIVPFQSIPPGSSYPMTTTATQQKTTTKEEM